MVRSGPRSTVAVSVVVLLAEMTPARGYNRPVGYRLRSVRCDIHYDRDRRVTRSRGQRVASSTGNSPAGDSAGRAVTAGFSGSQSPREKIDQGYGAVGWRDSGVGHGHGEYCSGLPLLETTRVTLRDSQIGAAGDRGGICSGVICGFAVSAAAEGRCVGYGCGCVDGNVHVECDCRIAGARSQSASRLQVTVAGAIGHVYPVPVDRPTT